MKKVLFFIIITIIISFFACQKNNIPVLQNPANPVDSLAGKWVLKVLDSTNHSSICDVQVINQRIAYLSDNYGYVWKTMNSGVTWTKRQVYSLRPGTTIPAIHFLDSLNGYALHGGFNGLRFFSVTTDGGNTWTMKPISIPWSTSTAKDIFFINKAVGFVVLDSNGNYRPGYIYKTIDSGKTWVRKAICRDPTKVFFASPKKGWVIDYNGALTQTYDGGETWTDVMMGTGNIPFNETVHGFHAYDTSNFASGNYDGITFHRELPGVLYYEPIIYRLAPYYGNPVSVYLLSPTQGYLISLGRTEILKCNTLAANQVTLDTAFQNERWTEMSFYDSTFGIIGGWGGHILIKHN